MREASMARWLPDDGFIGECLVCGDGPDFLETDQQPGFENEPVVVCAIGDSVYDPMTGEVLEEGNA
jgi:hypothetical protein